MLTTVGVFAVLLLVRAALPVAVRAYVQRSFERLEGYGGSIADIDVNLWRGTYSIADFQLHKLHGGASEPFFSASRLDLEVQWGALLRGRIVAEAVLHHPRLEFVVGETDADSQTGEDASWARTLDSLLPFQINRFVLRDGEIRYRDTTTEPVVDLYMQDVYLEALNISNVRTEKPALLPAEVEFAGRPLGSGELEGRLRFDPLTDPVRFEFDVAMRKVRMQDLNDLLLAYGDLDAERGTMALFAEFAGQDGHVEGYVKTLFEDLELVSFRDVDTPGEALSLLWDALASVAAEVFENQQRDRFATLVPISMDLERAGTDYDLIALVGSMLRNSFVVALRPALDDSIGLGNFEIDDLDQHHADFARRGNLPEPDARQTSREADR